ncbi:hypothetical protein [Polymorphobacter megasporae]|uniref:hypothetical protein n=1 Tax=Glacieibacterium megasporae TaxID=2835787 RepID=UPI001C1E432F|nr:hypothetical protein [Polymorphobacter megasporae]UAJ10496.1 hypothetical protein KTC28_01655 [Polymorphobacter megasporae]
MILKTYMRLFTTDAEASLATLRSLHGGEPHMRLTMNDWELIAIGDILLVAGSEQSLAPIRNSQGPIVVDDLNAAKSALEAGGATISKPIAEGPTGRYLYAIHADGNVVEYAEWKPELVQRWYRTPKESGKPSAQM